MVLHEGLMYRSYGTLLQALPIPVAVHLRSIKQPLNNLNSATRRAYTDRWCGVPEGFLLDQLLYVGPSSQLLEGPG